VLSHTSGKVITFCLFVVSHADSNNWLLFHIGPPSFGLSIIDGWLIVNHVS
jgi:hypothetical protein